MLEFKKSQNARKIGAKSARGILMLKSREKAQKFFLLFAKNRTELLQKCNDFPNFDHFEKSQVKS